MSTHSKSENGLHVSLWDSFYTRFCITSLIWIFFFSFSFVSQVRALHTAEERATSLLPNYVIFMTARKFRSHILRISARGVVGSSLLAEQRERGSFRRRRKKKGGGAKQPKERCRKQQPEAAGTRAAATGKEAVARALVRGALQRRNFCKSCPPACYQRRAGLWFCRSRNPALTAGLFFDKQDASIRGCQHPGLLERKEVVQPHPSSRPGRVRGGRGVLFQEAFQRSDQPAGAAAGKAARSARGGRRG